VSMARATAARAEVAPALAVEVVLVDVDSRSFEFYPRRMQRRVELTRSRWNRRIMSESNMVGASPTATDEYVGLALVVNISGDLLEDLRSFWNRSSARLILPRIEIAIPASVGYPTDRSLCCR
jgi:hypothetical protein